VTYEGNCHLGDLFTSRREKGRQGLPTLSVTINEGVVRRDSLDRKQETSLLPEEHLLARRNDIAYNMMRMWQGAFGLVNQEGLVSPAYVVLTPKENVDPLYASFLFKASRSIYLFWAYSHGLTEDRLRLYFDDFAKIPVLVPNLDAQRAIGRLFRTWDDALAKAHALLENSRHQKLALMQLLLTGQKRIGPFIAKRRVAHLGEFFSERVETGFQNLPLLSITRDDGVVPRNEISEKDVSSIDKTNYRRICPGDIGYNTMRMWQGISALSSLEGIISPAYTVVIPNQDINGRFFAHLFKFAPVVFQFYRYSQGLVSDTWNLSFKDFAAIRVEIPSLEEQIAIADVLDTADGVINAAERLVQRLEQEKRALMQQLLIITGKHQVHLLDATAAAAP